MINARLAGDSDLVSEAAAPVQGVWIQQAAVQPGRAPGRDLAGQAEIGHRHRHRMGAARRRTGAHDGGDPGLGRAGVRQGDVMNPTIQPVNDGETRAAQFIVLPPGEDPSDDDVGQGRGRPLFRCPEEFARLHRRLQTTCHLGLAGDPT
ncbi:hypothetical protein D3C86_1266120 [compost metagenome]